MKQIGPILSVNDDFVPNMQDALETDWESGAHGLNNAKAEEINKLCPTVLAMAALIEQERDELKERLDCALRAARDIQSALAGATYELKEFRRTYLKDKEVK